MWNRAASPSLSVAGKDMTNLKTELPRRVFLQILLLGLCLGQGTDSYSQTQQVPYEKGGKEDRAGQQAEQMVSLSAVAIRQILDREPGLLLEVKKLLVRKAFEQGRLLDPDDLSDDNLFSLLQLDATVRILATREIEAR